MLVLPNVTIEPLNVKKNKGTIECEKSTITCDINITQCEDEIVKCNVLIIWYSRMSTS